MDNKLKILAIIVTYNGSAWIRNCLGSLIASSLVSDVFCVDNLSSDNTLEIIKAEFPMVVLIENKENFGFGKANNIGFKFALENDYDFVFLLNQDAWVNRNTLQSLITVALKHPEYGIISPIHLNGLGDRIDLRFSEYITEIKCPGFISDKLLNNPPKDVYELPFVNAAAWLIPINTLKVVGGFDPIFFHYGEDDNYCQRLKYHGLKIGLIPSAKIFHDRDQTLHVFQPFISINNFDRLAKVELANVNIQDFSKIFRKFSGKIKTSLYASLITLDYSNFKKWIILLKHLFIIKKNIFSSYQKNKKINNNYPE